ncbi:MAG: DUF362 domain-containing protein [Clostridia bacterium]|nr:DUF362 domain-containing protein [Clostridia bacterium]
MEKSKVYFTNMRAPRNVSMLHKLDKLMTAAGFNDIDFEKKFAAIKIHFGEPGNLSFVRPNYAKVVADRVKALGGLPFLTDCNTLYPGRRKHGLEHLESAQENGFNPTTCGCQIIIADGLKGTDETIVPLTGTTYIKEAKIGHAIMDADVVISLNHFKGHGGSGFGGAIKNIGMGCGSRAGKMEQHCDGKPEVNPEVCRGCRACAKACAHDAISFADKKASIDHSKCVGCGRCIGTCNFDAIHNHGDADRDSFLMRMAEYTYAVLKDRPAFHINLVMQVSPDCDCFSGNDLPIIPDVGIFASFDPVALDRACADACNKMPPMPGSVLDERHKDGCSCHDHFQSIAPSTSWKICLDHCEKLGLGTQEYELITV